MVAYKQLDPESDYLCGMGLFMWYGPLLFKYFHAVHLCYTAVEMLHVTIRLKIVM